MASTRAVPKSGKPFETRRLKVDCDAPRPQLIVSHGPISFTLTLPLSSKPSKANAVSAISLLTPLAFTSTPCVRFTGSADRYRKIGDTVIPYGASHTADRLM